VGRKDRERGGEREKKRRGLGEGERGGKPHVLQTSGTCAMQFLCVAHLCVVISLAGASGVQIEVHLSGCGRGGSGEKE
jgi:hypothetical protein